MKIRVPMIRFNRQTPVAPAPSRAFPPGTRRMQVWTDTGGRQLSAWDVEDMKTELRFGDIYTGALLAFGDRSSAMLLRLEWTEEVHGFDEAWRNSQIAHWQAAIAEMFANSLNPRRGSL